MDDFKGSWIWTEQETPERNSFVRFRKTFEYEGGIARLRITADSRYVLYVNGEYIGQGPVRCWPAHYRYDEYDLEPILKIGNNVIAVLVNHYGESTFQYISGPAGLLAELSIDEQAITTDESWKAEPDKSFISIAPRICVQEGFEEQYDANCDGVWHELNYNDSLWSNAIVTRSHCHGWSAAPTYFLSSYVLGVRPGGSGYKPAVIEPRPGDLKWCRGIVPTPHGDIAIQWENIPDKPFTLKVNAPESVNFVINLPREGKVVINGMRVS